MPQMTLITWLILFLVFSLTYFYFILYNEMFYMYAFIA